MQATSGFHRDSSGTGEAALPQRDHCIIAGFGTSPQKGRKTMFLLEQALEDLAKVESMTALECYVDQLRSTYAVANMVLHVISSPRVGLSDPLIIATYEEHWKTRYFERDYFQIDPVVQEGAKSFLPLDWTDIDRSSPRMRALFAEAESYGVGTQGISVSIRGPRRETALVTLTSFETDESWLQRRASLLRDFHSLAHFLLDRSLVLAGLASRLPATKLSPREKQCLELLARGDAPKKIAHRLDLSIRTVRLYLSSAKLKLRAPNINAAIALAVHEELVALR